MGAFLDKPKTEKQTASGSGNGLRFGLSAMQGWRVEMEDAHAAVVGLPQGLQEWSYFGVFDGHAGASVSKYCADNLLGSILATDDFNAATKSASCPNIDQLKSGAKTGFLEMDAKMRDILAERDKSGSTAIVAFISPSFIVFSNCGDSRAIFSSNGEVTFCSVDHKPSNADEKSRIEKAGGSVMIQRVNGSLAVSRALGDFEYKMDPNLAATAQLVSPEPEVSVENRNGQQDEFIILACDGVWDVMSNEEVADFVRSRLLLYDDMVTVCNELLDTCLAKGSRDNMSAVLVAFEGAPKVSQEAIEKEAQLDALLEKKVVAIVEEANDKSDVDLMSVVQQLSSEDIEGLPPGGGLAAKRKLLQSVLDRLVPRKEEENDETWTPPLLRHVRDHSDQQDCSE